MTLDHKAENKNDMATASEKIGDGHSPGSRARPGSRILPKPVDLPTVSKTTTERQRTSSGKGNHNYGPFFLEYSLLAEYNQLQKQQIPGVYVIPSVKSALHWHGMLFVRQGIYQEGIFRFSLHIPENYPEGECPRLIFDPPVFHPVIDPESGELDVKRTFSKWRRNVNHIWQVLLYTRRIFYKIDSKNPLNEKAAKLYEQDPEMFKKKASDCVKMCKEKVYDLPKTDDPYAFRFSHWDPTVHADARKKMLTPKRKPSDKLTQTHGYSWMTDGCHIFEKKEFTDS